VSETALASFSLEEWAEIKRAIANGAPYANRMSIGLAIRLSRPQHESEQLGVLREIDALEGLRPETRTKRAEQFKHPPLAPLWHKHFYSPRHMLRNLGDRWNIARGRGNDDLDSLLSGIAADCGDDPARWPRELIHRFIIGGLRERADTRRLTGDWIIFAKHKGQNYYLDLATHEEGNGPVSSEHLMQKLRAGSRAEFPFLFETFD
jgi:hypothetical protein